LHGWFLWGQRPLVGIEEPRTHHFALLIRPLAHQPFRVGEVVQPSASSEFPQAVFSVQVERGAGDSLLRKDAVAGGEVQRDRRRAVAHDLDRYPRTQAIVCEARGLGKDGGLNHAPGRVIAEGAHGIPLCPFREQLPPVGPVVGLS